MTFSTRMAQQTEHFDSSSLSPCGRAEDDGHPDAYPAAFFIDYDDEPNIMTDSAWALLDGHRDHESRRFRAEDASKRFLSLLQPMGNIISMELEPELSLDTPNSQSLTVSASYKELYDRLDDCDPIEFPLAPSSATLPTSPSTDVTVFESYIDQESLSRICVWNSRTSSLLASRTKHTPIEKCVDPSMLSLVPIPTAHFTLDSEDEEEEEGWDAFDARDSKDDAWYSSEAENDDALVEFREPTPGLSATASISPSPSSAYPSTPTADWAEHLTSRKDSVVPNSKPCNPRNGKGHGSPSKLESIAAGNTVLSSTHMKGNKGKQRAEAPEDPNLSSLAHPTKGTSQNSKIVKQVKCSRKSPLSGKFMIRKFDLKLDIDESLTFDCPFPLEEAIGHICQTRIPRVDFFSHLSCHVSTHGGKAVQCPCCDFCSTGLSRHMVDCHFQVRNLLCPCGKTIVRPTADQIYRHLNGPQHARLPYPDVNDPLLVEEEREEKKREKIKKEEERKQTKRRKNRDGDKEEGSNKGTKRRRF